MNACPIDSPAQWRSWRIRLAPLVALIGLSFGLGARATEPVDLNVTANLLADSNVSKGRDRADRIADQGARLAVRVDRQHALTARWLNSLELGAGLEGWNHTRGLSHTFLEANWQLRYRRAGSFGEPTYSLFARATGENFVSSLRDGYRTSVGVSAQKDWTDRIATAITLASNERRARSQVFTGHDRSLALNVDYALGQRALLYVGAEWRRGDEVSSGRVALDQLEIAKRFVDDDAFKSSDFQSYRFDARTRLLTLGWNYRLGDDHGLDVSLLSAVARPTEAAQSTLFARAARYRTNQLKLTYLVRY